MSEKKHSDSIYDNSQYPPRKHPDRNRSPRKYLPTSKVGTKKVLLTLLLVFLTTTALLCCFGAIYINTVIKPIAREFHIEDFGVNENSVLLYQDQDTGIYKELTTVLSDTSASWVEYEDIPDDLKKAAVAIEDKRFWSHPGIDWRRTGKAVLCMFTGQDIQGGSTITQQLIKNLTDYNETTVKRKIVEIIRALEFNKNYSKEFTLEWYLNIIPLGSGCEGVGAAAQEYFGKPVSDLSLAECASLISITNNPSRYGPYSPAKAENKEGELWSARQWNKWRQENVLREMLSQKLITEEEYNEAVAEELNFVKGENEEKPQAIYSWYEETVISDVKRDMKEKLQYSESMINRLLSKGGLRIYTCVDPDVQAAVDSVYENRANLNQRSARGSEMQSAITVIDNETGDVVAIAGRVGEKTGNRWKNFATDAYRQPGSSIKPLAVYSPALEYGLITPATVVDDYPYQVLNGKPWPVNSGSASYKGLTTVREGLAKSVNTVAVRVLANYLGVDKSFDFVQDRYKIDLEEGRSINGNLVSDKTLALAMGGLTDGVTTRDMAEAYATFPSDGIYRTSRTYTKITQIINDEEVVLLENDYEQDQAIKPSTAYYMNSMLQGVTSSGGTAPSAKIGNIATAGKTGTTTSNFDRWFVGYTPYYTAAVWTGYEYNETMSGSNRSIDMWKLVMSKVHHGLRGKDFTTPDGLVKVSICKDSGLLATSYCGMDPRGSRVTTERMFEGDAPTEYCTCHSASSVMKICTGGSSTSSGWHTAGSYCPAGSVHQYCFPDYQRKSVGGATAADSAYFYSFASRYSTCNVHNTPLDLLFPDAETDAEDPNNPDPNNAEKPTVTETPEAGNPNPPATPPVTEDPLP